MTPTEILNEIHRLSLAEQKVLREKLLNDPPPGEGQIIQDDFDRHLFEEGFLARLPDDADEEDEFEPVEFSGQPISETIIEERR